MQQEKDDEFERTMARRMHGKGWRDDRERGENDMIKLEHIIFYRGLGFSLNQFLGNSFDCQQGCGG